LGKYRKLIGRVKGVFIFISREKKTQAKNLKKTNGDRRYLLFGGKLQQNKEWIA